MNEKWSIRVGRGFPSEPEAYRHTGRWPGTLLPDRISDLVRAHVSRQHKAPPFLVRMTSELTRTWAEHMAQQAKAHYEQYDEPVSIVIRCPICTEWFVEAVLGRLGPDGFAVTWDTEEDEPFLSMAELIRSLQTFLARL